MKYADTGAVKAGMKFTSPGGLTVETTGKSTKIDSHNLYVHEVVIVDGAGKGRKYLLNLDSATPS
ncbi:MAG: hypothetical protein FJ319_06705 [SAR202 cluster bacterium]|nr:hypothetical protein [SAR202 cluster bacterium]